MCIWDLRSNMLDKIINIFKKNWVLKYMTMEYIVIFNENKIKINISVKWGKYAIFHANNRTGFFIINNNLIILFLQYNAGMVTRHCWFIKIQQRRSNWWFKVFYHIPLICKYDSERIIYKHDVAFVLVCQ